MDEQPDSAHAVDKALVGSIDLHCHPGPASVPREWDLVQGGRYFAEHGFAAAVAKAHHHPTGTDATVANRYGLADLEFEFWGSVVLNNAVGGLNPFAVEAALHADAKVVWLPTLSARHNLAFYAGKASGHPVGQTGWRKEEPVDVVADDGSPVSALDEIIALVRDGDAILASGHISPTEALTVFGRARELGLQRMVVTHPTAVVEATLDQGVELADLGAWIEHSLVVFDSVASPAYQPIDVLVDWIRGVGPERTILASDTGLVGVGWPFDLYRRVGGELLANGITEDDLRQMCVVNPRAIVEGRRSKDDEERV